MRSITSLVVMLVALTMPAIAATFKWVDEKGVTHYGDSLPADDSKRGGAEINQQGKVIRKYEAVLTPEQQKARDADIAKQNELDQQREEQRRSDLALVNAYTAEQDIDLARDRHTQSIDTTIRNADDRIQHNAVIITELQKQLEFFKGKEKDGTPRVAPPQLVQELERTKSQQPALEAAIVELRKEREQVAVRFAQDKQRFREIKDGMAGNAQASSKEGRTVRSTKSLVIDKASERLINDCVSQWRDTQRFGVAHAVGAELVQDVERTDLVLDGRVRNKQGSSIAARFVCTLTADGKIDNRATEVRKALASLGARY
jgi:hypothetical protein